MGFFASVRDENRRMRRAALSGLQKPVSECVSVGLISAAHQAHHNTAPSGAKQYPKPP